MKVVISVPEVVSNFKEIQEQPERLFEMIRVDVRENVGEYLSQLMDMERTIFLEEKGGALFKFKFQLVKVTGLHVNL